METQSMETIDTQMNRPLSKQMCCFSQRWMADSISTLKPETLLFTSYLMLFLLPAPYLQDSFSSHLHDILCQPWIFKGLADGF